MRISRQLYSFFAIILATSLFTACDDDSGSSANEQNEQNEQNENDHCNGGCTCSHCKCACDDGFHFYEDDCEEDTINHCGSHGNACSTESFPNSKTVACVEGKCAIETCINDYHLNRTGQCETCSGNTIWNEATQSCDDKSEPVNCAELINGLNAGDTINFGRYWQIHGIGEKQPIEWMVLDTEDERGVLLLTKYILDAKAFSIVSDYAWWENSSLRSWLNGLGRNDNISDADFTDDNFMKTAFTAEEMQCIATVVNHTKGLDDSVTKEFDTTDRVFLLSNEEAVVFFNNDTRRAYATSYARYQGLRVNLQDCVDSTCVAYWSLRHANQKFLNTYTVTIEGLVNRGFAASDSSVCGVRPAIVLKK